MGTPGPATRDRSVIPRRGGEGAGVPRIDSSPCRGARRKNVTRRHLVVDATAHWSASAPLSSCRIALETTVAPIRWASVRCDDAAERPTGMPGQPSGPAVPTDRVQPQTIVRLFLQAHTMFGRVAAAARARRPCRRAPSGPAVGRHEPGHCPDSRRRKVHLVARMWMDGATDHQEPDPRWWSERGPRPSPFVPLRPAAEDSSYRRGRELAVRARARLRQVFLRLFRAGGRHRTRQQGCRVGTVYLGPGRYPGWQRGVRMGR